MDLSSIVEVRLVFDVEQINKLLEEGWVILAVTSENSPNVAEFDSVIKCMLGLPRERA